MKNHLKLISIVALNILSLSGLSQDLTYPPTIEREVINSYHGVNVYDRYQWLENIYSPEVRIWVEGQNLTSEKYLRKLANRNNSINEMNAYMARDRRWSNTGKFNFDGERKSNYRLFYTNYFSGPSIYYRKRSYNEFKILVDSRYLFKTSEDRQTEIISFKASQDDEILAYQYSVDGRPWGEIRLKRTEGSNSPSETLYQTQLGQINWYKSGFFYQKAKKDSTTGEIIPPAIYYHRINTSQKSDSLVFKTNNPYDQIHLYSTIAEELFLIEIENKAKSEYSYLYWKPNGPVNGFKPIVYRVNYSFEFVDYIDDKLVMEAVLNNKTQLISINPDNPKDLTIISKDYTNAVITRSETINDQLIAISYQALNKPFLCIVDINGNIKGEVDLPAGVTLSGLSYQKESDRLFFLLKSFTIPPVMCQVNMKDYSYEIIEKTGVNFDFKSYKFSETKFTSTDGVEVPIFIVYKEQLKTDGSTPMLLEAYRGFGAVSTSNYDPEVIYFIENGGAYAFTYTRGGGELGNDWWDAGKKLNKKNGINDFIGASEFLLSEGYTAPKKLGIIGYGHGGLLAAAALTQRPELYGAVVLNDALTDMLRYEENNMGSSIVDEFGSTTASEEFFNLADYSPYHHIDNSVSYPPVLVTATFFDHRISPMHSYKLTAALQNNPAQTAPALLFTNSDIGSYGGQSMLDHLETSAMKVAFLHEFLLKN